VFHLELRAASHRLHRLNLGEQELLESVLSPWVRGERIEMGERIWSAATGSIVVLEGPEIPVGRLTMGRGWSVAQSEGRDVTEAMLDRVRAVVTATAAAGAEAAIAASASDAALQVPASPTPAAVPSTAEPPTAAQGVAGLIAPVDAEVLADALGLELLRRLGETPMSLLAAWKIAAKRHPQLPIGVGLELAQRAVASLARAGLIVLTRAGDRGGHDLRDRELDATLQSVDSWTTESREHGVWFRRA
jgi:hypothetical protein